MKKYILSIFAVVLAVGMVAFTAPEKNLQMVTFTYSPQDPNDFSQTSVQDKDNWVLGSASCNNGEDRACTFDVPSEKTALGGTKLGADISISAEEGTLADNYYVAEGTFISNIHNKD